MREGAVNLGDVPPGIDGTLSGFLGRMKEAVEVLQGTRGRASEGRRAPTLAETTRIVNRGNTASWDFLAGDFVKDGNWHELSLAGIIPTGTIAVLMRAHIDVSATGYGFWMGHADETGDINCFSIRPQVAGLGKTTEGIVFVNAARRIRYKADAAPTWSGLGVAVKGWFV